MFFIKFRRKLILVFLLALCLFFQASISYSASLPQATTIYPTKNYSVGPNGIEKHIFLGNQVIATIDGEGKTATVYYIYPDHLNSSGVITNEAEELEELIDYYAFGSVRFNQSFNKRQEKRKFIGQEYDQSTGLNYLNARYYDANLARFMSQDPLFWQIREDYLVDPQQQNSYSYSRNNPIVYSDPFGLSSAIYNAIPSGGWRFGQKMGEFNGVIAYYNGIGSSGTTYSCVEYAKRYQAQVYGIKNIGPVGDAKTMWTMLNTINNRLANAKSAYTFTKHNNGDGFNLPSEGDLLFWTEGKYGHVMVVTESKFDTTTNKGHVEIIDQNASQKAVRSFDVKKTDKGYLVMRNESSPLAGWFSPTPVNHQTKAQGGVAPSPVPTKSAQPSSFFKNFFSRVQKFFQR